MVRSRQAFTLVELLVVIAIIGVLVGLLLPAVQAAREAARRMDCSNRVKQIGLAMHNYESTHKTFPAGNLGFSSAKDCTSGGNKGGASWTVLILPFLEQSALYDSFDTGELFTSTSNLPGDSQNHELFLLPNASYQCPSDPGSRPGSNNTSYYGVQGGGPDPVCSSQSAGRMFYDNGMLFVNSRMGFRDMTDGSTSVFVVGETRYNDQSVENGYSGWASSAKMDSWGMPGVLAGARDQINAFDVNPLKEKTLDYQTRTFGSHHPGGCHFGMGDGSVQFVTESIDLVLYQTLAIRDDGLPIGGLP